MRFSHGFNFALATTPAGWQTLLDTVPLVCKALATDGSAGGSDHAGTARPARGQPTYRRLYTWEYGNEPDLLSTSAQGPTRAPQWNESTYVQQWLNGTRQLWQLIGKHCPKLVQTRNHSANASSHSPPADFAGFMGPSFAGTNNHLKALATWKAGLGADGNVALFSSHK